MEDVEIFKYSGVWTDKWTRGNVHVVADDGRKGRKVGSKDRVNV